MMTVQMSDGNITTTSQGKVCTIRLTVNNAKNIGIEFDQFNLSDSAVMYIYNDAKTELSGPIKKTSFSDSTNSIGIAPINGSSVIVYIIEKNNFSTFLSIIHTSQVMAGYQDWGVVSSSDSASLSPRGGIFDPSDCDPSIRCSPDKLLVARAVALFGTNGRGGTGTLINNELGNGRPFFLTAFHVLDRNKNNQIDPSEVTALARSFFIFRYWKTSCNGGISTSYITFYGATLRAAWHGSDLILLELNNGPGIGDGVTYAGWNRSTSAPSNSNSFIIHHPESKDMRITTTSLVHSYLLDGKFWQAFYSNGTVYKGSSGSALFNEDDQVVGQPKGGWSSCVFPFFSDRYGKLSSSWNGGGTNSTRLMNWLSPNQNLQSTDLLDLTSFSITGPDVIACTTPAQYTTNHPNLFNVTYSWSVSAGLQIVSGQGTGSVSISGLPGNEYGAGTVSLTLTSATGLNRTYSTTKNVTINTGRVSGTYNSPTNSTEPLVPIPHRNLTQYNVACIALQTKISVPSGSTVSWSGSADPGVTWYQVGNNAFCNFTAVGQEANLAVSMTNSCGLSSASYRFKCTTANSCGIEPLIVTGKEIFLWPNPATNTITITNQPPKISYSKGRSYSNIGRTTGLAYIRDVEVYDVFGKLRLHKIFSEKVNQIRLDISGLTSGTYLIKISDGKFSTTQKIIIR